MTGYILYAGYLAIALAAICDAVIDTVLFHPRSMVFKNTNYFTVDYFYRFRPWYKKIGGDAFHDFKKLRDLFHLSAVAAFVYASHAFDLYIILLPLPVIIYIFHETFFKYFFVNKKYRGSND